jgi:NADH:ubiquinone oxidoreductase subunit D
MVIRSGSNFGFFSIMQLRVIEFLYCFTKRHEFVGLRSAVCGLRLIPIFLNEDRVYFEKYRINK